MQQIPNAWSYIFNPKMTYHALIPVKSLKNAKSRLANNLSLEERKNLVLAMLNHVISILQSVKKISQITLVTSDQTIQEHINYDNISIFPEEKVGHNPALTVAAHHETATLLTISADLPLLTRDDVRQLLSLASLYDIVLAPAKDKGTNAILMKPLALPYLFGKNSFEKYSNEAKKRNLTVGIYKSQTTAFDIDTIADFHLLQKSKLDITS